MQKMDSVRDQGSSSLAASQSVVDEREGQLERRRGRERAHLSETAEQRQEHLRKKKNERQS